LNAANTASTTARALDDAVDCAGGAQLAAARARIKPENRFMSCLHFQDIPSHHDVRRIADSTERRM
jgi:hypothetical protein